MAERWIQPLFGLLSWSLQICIASFIFAFLYQIRNLSLSFNEDAVILSATWKIGVVLTGCIVGAIQSTTFHAVLRVSSPFEGPLSQAIRRLLARDKTVKDGIWAVTNGFMFHELYFDTKSRALDLFARLVGETGSPDLLDRAVPLLAFSEWMVWIPPRQTLQLSVENLKNACVRLLASDISIRVKATMEGQLSRLVARFKGKGDDGGWLIRTSLLEMFIGQFGLLSPKHFPSLVYLTSILDDNEDLLPQSELPSEECIPRVLCTFDQPQKLGERGELFYTAVKLCDLLLDDEKEDEASQLLSPVDHSSILRSFLANIEWKWLFLSDIVRFICRGREAEFIAKLASFISDQVNIVRVDGFSSSNSLPI
ncbi:hypothetical protein SISSUDRAFT_1067242 [Sistotremastrum suecicum HHB10207 ss-3]|uniref:Uncharacterized protein n=1 Tax=Sistotremastrum suecicum HHB10207 ss-3 TaxID=1314776 RepID=A0A165XBX8_9AGAM|nr:hypothetical protein SISSUDRAFT_1067242 [Sistotremastrum suecicum HHB10207 ss-3]